MPCGISKPSQQDQGCLPGIVLFLDNEDPAVVRLAVEVIRDLFISAKDDKIKKSVLLVLPLLSLYACVCIWPSSLLSGGCDF